MSWAIVIPRENSSKWLLIPIVLHSLFTYRTKIFICTLSHMTYRKLVSTGEMILSMYRRI